MSFSAAAVYAQPMVQRAGGPGGDCDPYQRPPPSAVVTDLDTATTWRDATAIDTNLCSEIE